MLRGARLRNIVLPAAFLTTAIVPSVVFVALAASSAASGTLVCALCWIAFAIATGRARQPADRQAWRTAGLILAVTTLLFVHGLLVDLKLGGVDFVRLSESCVTMIVVLLAAFAMARYLVSVPPALLASTARFIYIMLTLMGYAAAVGVPSLGGAAFQKPVIVFSEPSQFSLIYTPILLIASSLTTRPRQLLMLASSLILAALLENLTMFVGIFGASCLVLRRTHLLLLLGAASLAVVVLALDLNYYAQRLVLSGDSDSLSTLVYLQGWQRAVLNFRETGGMGVGFQQFGYVGSLGPIAERIAEIAGVALNLYDGGSTGSKLVGEFGAFGVVAILLYLRQVWAGILTLRRALRIPAGMRDVRRIFFYSFVVAYISELFIRGAGYISASGLMLAASLFAIAQLNASGAVPMSLPVGEGAAAAPMRA